MSKPSSKSLAGRIQTPDRLTRHIPALPNHVVVHAPILMNRSFETDSAPKSVVEKLVDFFDSEKQPRPWSQLQQELRHNSSTESDEKATTVSEPRSWKTFFFGDDKDHQDRQNLEQWLRKRKNSDSFSSHVSSSGTTKPYEPIPSEILGSAKHVSVVTSFERRQRIQLYQRALDAKKKSVIDSSHHPLILEKVSQIGFIILFQIWARLNAQRGSLAQLNRKSFPVRTIGSSPPTSPATLQH